MPDVRFVLGQVEQSLRPTLQPRLEGTPQVGGARLVQNLATFTLDPYRIVNGVPQDGASTAPDGDAGASPFVAVTAPLNPGSLFPEAYAHWVPAPTDLGVPEGGTRRWWPVGSPKTAANVRISLYSTLATSPNGADPYDANSPAIEVGYSYAGFAGEIVRPAMIFATNKAGHAGRAKIDPEGSFASVTLAITAVFHPSRHPRFGIFEAAQIYDPNSLTEIGTPLTLTYQHGAIRLDHAGKRVLSHESHVIAARPIVIMVSLDAVSDTGRLYALDANRTTRTFNTSGLDFVSLLGSIGALGQGTVANPYKLNAEMDVLDIVMWTEALDWEAMEAKANLLALAYGLVG